MARVRFALALLSLTALGLLGLSAARARPDQRPDVEVPRDMVYVPGGRTQIGSSEGPVAERPPFTVDVRPFLLDVHPVTVGEFRRFVEATGHVTDSERRRGSSVFDVRTGTWDIVRGATWRRPRGPHAPPAADDHPVTQVSWYDARAYCRSTGKRLPTEIEWEHAARGARNSGRRYAWGDDLVVAGRYMANTWQGHFPSHNSAADGYVYTSPVGAFGATSLGLTDMGGNVWQWCADWYRPYAERGTAFAATPESEKVIRGGSFLCDPTVCHGFRVSARQHTTPHSALMHIGFRCARDLEPSRRSRAPSCTPACRRPRRRSRPGGSRTSSRSTGTTRSATRPISTSTSRCGSSRSIRRAFSTRFAATTRGTPIFPS